MPRTATEQHPFLLEAPDGAAALGLERLAGEVGRLIEVESPLHIHFTPRPKSSATTDDAATR
ncbi:MAG: hypothetical protein QM775_28635 [Pirellulales bacterium]